MATRQRAALRPPVVAPATQGYQAPSRAGKRAASRSTCRPSNGGSFAGLRSTPTRPCGILMEEAIELLF